MNAKLRNSCLVAGLVGSLLGAPVGWADDSGWFAGINVRSLLRGSDSPGSVGVYDYSASGEKIYGAYRFNSHWGIEMGYAEPHRAGPGAQGYVAPDSFGGALNSNTW